MVIISVSESGEEARVKELDLNSNVINDQDDLVEASFVGPLPVLQKVQFPGQNGREYFFERMFNVHVTSIPGNGSYFCC